MTLLSPQDLPSRQTPPSAKKTCSTMRSQVKEIPGIKLAVKFVTVTCFTLPVFSVTDFSWSKDAKAKMATVFKLSKFRPLQRAAINLSMSGRDLFLVMPTGRGKSLCYQLPATCSKGKWTNP